MANKIDKFFWEQIEMEQRQEIENYIELLRIAEKQRNENSMK